MTAPNQRGRLGCKLTLILSVWENVGAFCIAATWISRACPVQLKKAVEIAHNTWESWNLTNPSPPPKNSEHQPWILRWGLQAVHTAIDAVTSGHVIKQLTLNLMYSTILGCFDRAHKTLIKMPSTQSFPRTQWNMFLFSSYLNGYNSTYGLNRGNEDF